MVTPSCSSAMTTVRSDAVLATFSALGLVFSMGLNRLTTRSSPSSWGSRLMSDSCPPQAVRDSAASTAKKPAAPLRAPCFTCDFIVVPPL